MEEALYSKYGFFNNEKVRSKKSGDFLTSPEVSEYFGKILNKWIQKNNLDLRNKKKWKNFIKILKNPF